MNLLEPYNFVVKSLAVKPFSFYTPDVQNKIVKDVKTTTAGIKKIFEKNNLKKSQAFQVILAVESSVKGGGILEVDFINNLLKLIEVYQQSIDDPNLKQFIDKLQTNTELAQKNTLGYYLGLEVLNKELQELSAKKIKAHDLGIIEKIGFFYILEYTLYVLHLLSKLDKEDGKKLFYNGFKTDEANLPPYTVFANSFRCDLCLKIYQKELRKNLFEIFFQFEEVFAGGNFLEICVAFKQFNLALLKIFKNEGVTTFKAVILKPFGSKISISELIKKVEELKITNDK